MTLPIVNVIDFLTASKASELELSPSPVRVLGIDLGTTNSTVAEIVWQEKEAPVARCLEIEQPTETGPYIHVLVPSVVALYQGQTWVGEGAKRLRAHPGFKRNKDIFYECKNEMGVRRTYHLAPEGFRSAAEIGAKVLAFLKSAAEEIGEAPARTVITVPASFQLAQRNDTLKAARLADLSLQAGDLLDEPVAAFLDYLITHRDDLVHFDRPQVLVVFDFGGGTCDVAVLRLHPLGTEGPIEIAPLAASRYHRLGGGDIDAAIVHEVLIPQLVEQNQLGPHALEYDQRKRHLEPQLLSVAEALKVGLCIEIARLHSFGRYEQADKHTIAKTHPGAWPCPCPGFPQLVLRSPQLTAAQFEKVLNPFLDTEFLYARETEYYLTCSIFAPLQDALDRAGLGAEEVDLCLLVGGSSLIPQVQEAVRRFFPAARMLTYEDRDSTQVAVARGAAYHALSVAMFGRSLVQPVAHDCIGLRVVSGLLNLIPKGTRLPYPDAGQFAEHLELVVPKTTLTGSVPLRVEVVAGEEARLVYAAKWEIPGPVNRGDPLCLKVRMDSNQCLYLELSLKERPEEPFVCTIENPITQIVNPHAARQRIDELEEDLRSGKVEAKAVPETLREIAEKYVELRQIDRGIDYLKQALRRLGHPKAEYLNLLGMWYGQKQDWERQEKAYREAFRVNSQWSAPLFNLALSQYRRSLLDEAEATIKQALALEPDPPYQVLYAEILAKHGDGAKARKLLQAAIEQFEPVEELDDWALGWLHTAVSRLQNQALLAAVQAEQKRRQTTKETVVETDGWLPELTSALRKV
ncbi:MAG: Hsp70 family protein [Methylohalobius sp.]|nr:Hsp70 family protein [Methylohalobius sp.]